MKITLEKIKGMNILIGTPIEIKVKMDGQDFVRKELGYFQGIYDYRNRWVIEKKGIIIRSGIEDSKENKSHQPEKQFDLEYIREINILDYKKK